MELLDNFFQRFLTEVTNLHHVILGTVDQIFYGIDAGPLQAVEAADRHVKLLNGHLKNLFLDGFFAFNHDFRILCLVGKIDEQIEMLVEYLGAERNRFFRQDHTIGQHFQSQSVIVGVAAHTGVLDGIVYVINRSVNRVGEDGADGSCHALAVCQIELLVLFLRHISTAMIESQLHIEANIVTDSGDMVIRIQDLNVCILLDIGSSDIAGSGGIDYNRLGAVGMELCGDALHIQHDFRNIFLDAGNGGDFMQDAVDLDAGHSHAGERAQQHTAQRVAQCDSVSSFQGLDDELTVSSIFA